MKLPPLRDWLRRAWNAELKEGDPLYWPVTLTIIVVWLLCVVALIFVVGMLIGKWWL